MFYYLQTIDGIHENLEDYNLTKKRNVLIVFYCMMVHMEVNKDLKPIGAELFMRGRKLNILVVFMSQSYFTVPKTIRLNVIHYLYNR